MFKIYDQQQELKLEEQDQVIGLFRDSYFNYHYIDEICSKERVRFIAFNQNKVIGYATYRTYSDYAYFSNLVVMNKYRGQGIGKQLEKLRFNHAKETNQLVYVSCTCDDTYSQRLKVSLGLTPCCIKYGYRESVSLQDHIGSALIFTDANPQVDSPSKCSINVSHLLKRITIIMTKKEDIEIINFTGFSDYYIEVLVGKELFDRFNDSSYNYNGVDLDLSTGKWHYIFQVKNQKYYEGINYGPKLLVIPEKIINKISI